MKKTHTPAVMHALGCMGRNIRIARKKRRIPVGDFAARLGVSAPTVTRLEKGDPGVSIGCLAQALRALGELHRLEELLDMAADDAGLVMEAAALPQRIRRRHPVGEREAGAEVVTMAASAPLTGTAF